jgi:hypothetical protein
MLASPIERTRGLMIADIPWRKVRTPVHFYMKDVAKGRAALGDNNGPLGQSCVVAEICCTSFLLILMRTFTFSLCHRRFPAQRNFRGACESRPGVSLRVLGSNKKMHASLHAEEQQMTASETLRAHIQLYRSQRHGSASQGSPKNNFF